MKSFCIYAALTASILCAGPAGAEPGVHLFTQQLEGVYTQSWYARDLGMRDGRNESFVTGTGKLGDFNGVMAVDCETAAYSQWIALGGYLGADDVPADAIQSLRQLACNGA